MIIFVLHGFQGATPNRKTQVLDKHAKEFDIVGINYTYNPDNAYDEIVTQMEDAFTFYDTRQCAFLGTSLGAFWARFIAQDYGMLGILINPALDPLESLKKQVGVCKNYIKKCYYFFYSSHYLITIIFSWLIFYLNILSGSSLFSSILFLTITISCVLSGFLFFGTSSLTVITPILELTIFSE